MSIIKSLSVGNGDMFYIKHGSSNFSIIDCCMNEDNKENIVKELLKESYGKRVQRFISTHPDDDHIRGLKYLNQKMPILNFYCVENNAKKEDETDDFNEYCKLRDSDKAFFLYKDCKRKWMNQDGEGIGKAGINILWPIVDNEYYQQALKEAAQGNSPNNISPIIQYSLNHGVEVLWMGDLETDFMKSIAGSVSLTNIDILFAPHHGRDSGKVPKAWLDKLNPKVIVIGEAPYAHINYYPEFNTIKQNSAGDILFECGEHVVNIYVGNESYKEKFLEDDRRSDNHNLFYLGTLKV